MIEKVAKALHRAHYERGRGIAPKYDLLDQFQRAMWEFSARSAIEAMREPTAEMIKAGVENPGSDKYEPDIPYRAMISVALKE